jgi:hypothetical protein
MKSNIFYLPFGELFVSQRNCEFDSRYKFTAKELDNETSYTYFRARYYDIKHGETGGFLDIYDFDIKKGVEHIPRNITTWIGKQIAGQGTSYNIFYYGIGKVK